MTSTLSVPAEAKLRTADDFLIRVSAPVRGHLRLKVRIGKSPRVRLSLSAAQDELMKLRTWMEDIARGVSPARIRFADGTALCCRREYDDATGFAETERFLDEAYPTSVSTFCVRDAQGREYRALLKTKHFELFSLPSHTGCLANWKLSRCTKYKVQCTNQEVRRLRREVTNTF